MFGEGSSRSKVGEDEMTASSTWVVRPTYRNRWSIGIAAMLVAWSGAAWAENSACFFEDSKFRGLQLCVEGEAEVSSIRLDFNDKISSIKVARGWQVEACQHSKFQGWCEKYHSGVSSVGEAANDQISSYRVERIDDADPEQACFFEHGQFQGRKFCLESGESWNGRTDLSSNDIISSITVEEGLVVTVYEDGGFGGGKLRLFEDEAAMSPEWNDRISSIRVR